MSTNTTPALLDPAASRTWVLVTSPLCASCGPVAERLRRLDPMAALVTVDASLAPDLARELRVRAAPSLLLAGANGRVVHRLAGADAVDAHLSALSVD
jgi:thioredoxin-like negative regulator of GroEL